LNYVQVECIGNIKKIRTHGKKHCAISLALLFAFSLALSLALGSPVLLLAHSQFRYTHATSLPDSLSHSLSAPPFSCSLILDLDTTCLRHCQITSASCVRSCNRTLQDGSTIIIMTTFLKRKFPDSNFASQYLRS